MEHRRLVRFLLLGSLLLVSTALHALPPYQLIGDIGTDRDWSGVMLTADGASLTLPGEGIYRQPASLLGIYKHGFRVENDATLDWRTTYGLRFDVRLPNKTSVELKIQVVTDAPLPGTATATVTLSGADWQTVTLPWTAFDAPQARTACFKFVKELHIAARANPGTTGGQLELRSVRVIRGEILALDADIRGRSTEPDKPIEYSVSVGNCTDRPKTVSLQVDRFGWEAMTTTVSPATLELMPGETKSAIMRVSFNDQVAPGGNEQQVLRAIPNGDAGASTTLAFTTARALPHPYILHTPARWQEVREKVRRYDWARESQAEFVRAADEWRVPEIAQPPHNDPGDTMGPYLFATPNEHGLMACGVAWQLTGDKKYAEKIALFMRRLSDPEHGYNKTLRGCNQSLVQEGHFFQHIAMAYDMALDSGLFTEADQLQIAKTFRAFAETIDFESGRGAINNWNLSEDCGAFYCALVLQDLSLAERFFSGPSGIKDQLAKGTMDDGWWYECSISYNVWCASEFTQAALAYEPWGVNFRDMRLPANFSKQAMISAELSGGNTANETDEYAKRRPFGMVAELWGPNRKPYREIRDLWNSLLPFLDWRAVMFGVNDSTENSVVSSRREVGGQPFELAYYVYRDPAYAAILKAAPKRDLLYGVPELPTKTPERFRDSAYADNVGVTMLRSQTPGRPIREQIQAVLHYGTHGWAHGHFDRTSLLSLMRYGRSFYNPESVFYVYEPYMYKFYTQTSLNHNMVVVDQKMQEATESERLLFHSGSAMQATVVQTDSRWSNPPYGGMVYDYVPVKTFAEKQWREGRTVPNPIDPPRYGSITGFSEKILQRRLMVVTDDYIVLADYVKGAEAHTYESLLQIKGFLGLEAPSKKFIRHGAQWNTDPLGSAQFVTDCDWYSVSAPSVARFEQRWGDKFGADNEGTRTPYSEDGLLKLNVHTLWPQSHEIMIGTAPELHDVEKRLFYVIRGDGKILAEDKFGAWILGSAEIDIPVVGIKQLELETRVELSKKPTIFWANARIVTRDGREIPLSALPVTTANILAPKQSGQDYFGGPIKLVGQPFASATPGQPQDTAKPALVRVDLGKVDAVRFKATLGGDYPLGNEAQRRKVYAVRAPIGTEARFITVIEPYESKSVVKSAIALSAEKLRVELTDGRTQEIEITRFTGTGQDIVIHLTELKDGQTIRTEEITATKTH